MELKDMALAELRKNLLYGYNGQMLPVSDLIQESKRAGATQKEISAVLQECKYRCVNHVPVFGC